MQSCYTNNFCLFCTVGDSEFGSGSLPATEAETRGAVIQHDIDKQQVNEMINHNLAPHANIVKRGMKPTNLFMFMLIAVVYLWLLLLVDSLFVGRTEYF